MLKAFYAFKRGDYWQVKLKDEHGKALTAKSTRTKDRNEAEAIMWQWYFERNGSYYARQPQDAYYYVSQPVVQQATPAGTEYENMTVYELMSLFWGYNRSPYIAELERQGRKVPNPERFSYALGFIEQIKPALSRIKVKDVTGEIINGILQRYQHNRNTGNLTMKNYAAFFRQTFRYFYKKDLITKNISDKIMQFIGDTKAKAILTTDELQKLFSRPEYFPNETIRTFTKTLAVTGCRTGEILALQKGDLQYTENGYFLNINKNYTNTTKRLKSTKTGRQDFVFIPDDIAEALKGQMRSGSDFILSNKEKNEPVQYHRVSYYFKAACKKAGVFKENLTLHSLRHGFAVMARDKGITAEQLLLVTRHESLAGLKTYLNHASQTVIKKQREVVNYIDSILA